MHIEHVAIWTADLERLRAFYETYFGAKTGPLYESSRRPFRSRFLAFPSGARIELMQAPEVSEPGSGPRLGWAHLAFAAGSEEAVDELTARLGRDGYTVASLPRTTGDGCYESSIRDPEGNLVEITV